MTVENFDAARKSARFLVALALGDGTHPSGADADAILFHALTDPDREVRLAAASSLVSRDPTRSVDEILDPLRKADGRPNEGPPSATEVIEYHLAPLTSFDAGALLEQEARAPDAKTRAAAGMEIRFIADKAVVARVLRELLDDEDVDVRRRVALGLYALGADAAPVARHALRDSDAAVREAALTSLNGVTAAESITEIATEHLSDPSRKVRSAAKKLLKRPT